MTGQSRWIVAILIGYLIINALSFITSFYPLNYIVLLIYLFSCFIAYVGYFKQKKKTGTFLGFDITLFCLLTIFNWLISPKTAMHVDGVVNTSHIMTATITNLMAFFVAYVATTGKGLNVRKLDKLASLLFVLAFVSYMYSFMNLEASDKGTSVNGSYALMFLFLVMCLRGFTKKTNILLFIVFGLVVLSAKRGAIICLLIMILLYLYFRFLKGRRSSFFMIPIVLALLGSISYYVMNHNTNFQNKMEATSEGNASGRDYMYETLFIFWLQEEPKEQILGYKFAGSFELLERDAHNDWLELLIGEGLLGVTLYLIFFTALFHAFFKNKRYWYPHEKMIFLSSILIWFVKSFFSQSFYAGESIYLVIIFGFLLSEASSRQQYLGSGFENNDNRRSLP